MTDRDRDQDRAENRDAEDHRGSETTTVDRSAHTVDLTAPGQAGVERQEPPEDDLPSDRYLVEGPLGEGGMAVVHRARDVRLDRPVAVKCLREELEDSGTAKARFLDEARILAGLDHPGVVPVFDLGRLPDGSRFYAMKRVEGATLRDHLAARSDEKVRDRSNLEHFVDLFERVCRTVAAAHQEGIIHRDLKPENVMVDGRGEVYVMDWGLAKRLTTTAGSADAGRTRVGALLGTPAYMAPEQVRGEAHGANRGTDVFALGVMLYEVLTGRNPFASDEADRSMAGILHHQPDDPRRVNPRVPRPLAAVCMKALQKDPFRRYPSARELADDLRRYRELLPVSAYRAGSVERSVAWLRLHPVATGVMTTVAVMVLLAGSWLAVQASVERAMVARAYDRIDRARGEASRLAAEIAQAEERMDRVASPADRAVLEKAVDRLAVRREVQLRLAESLAIAVLGFTVLSPDDRAQKVLREDALGNIERYLAAGDLQRAEVLTRFALLTAEGNNLLELTDDEVGELRATLEKLEAPPVATPSQGSEAPSPVP